MNGARMAAQKMVVCPKCKAKLKFYPEKIKSEVVKFNCPGCASVLRIRKSGPGPDISTSTATSQLEQKSDLNLENPGAELLDLANKFEEEMGFAKDEQAQEPEEVEHKTEPVAAKEERPPEKKEDDAEPVEEPEEERAKGSKTRDFKRVKFKKKVLVNNQIMVEALDISENGLFLHTGRSFDDGAIVEVGIPTVPGSFDLLIQARVKHNHRGIGMGMEFVDLDDKQKTRLNTLISELDVAAKEPDGRKKILLVGGTDTARNINKSKLVLDGFYVLQATTADEFFQILEEEPPDAMVLEWQETAFYCKGLLAQIKEKPQYDAIIRVVLSALTDTFVQREIMDAGAHRYMAKMDTNPAKLSFTLKNLIDERDS